MSEKSHSLVFMKKQMDHGSLLALFFIFPSPYIAFVYLFIISNNAIYIHSIHDYYLLIKIVFFGIKIQFIIEKTEKME